MKKVDALIAKINDKTEELNAELANITGQPRGFKAAGLRARKLTNELTALYKEFRKESVAAENAAKG